ncbi:MAG: hypothetical protein P857_17 [Candidatus Xenolissoclinum pacificiensis L6]|uniref:Uncharacterized protein n=1 Tax=Candidatus Xenolissoclinum pacificiensis L6 TaxID=1401685 RepID=W2V0D6_9RICK|nr:MAG: hypothetical protein P857_17 [Candidatus Xenolissoclinum pacificiensis L6]
MAQHIYEIPTCKEIVSILQNNEDLKVNIVILVHLIDMEGFLTGGNKEDISFASELAKHVQGCYVVEDKGYEVLEKNYKKYPIFV